MSKKKDNIEYQKDANAWTTGETLPLGYHTKKDATSIKIQQYPSMETSER